MAAHLPPLLPLISSLALTKCLPRADLTDGYQSAAEIHQPNGLLTGVILTSIYIVFVSGGGEAEELDGAMGQMQTQY